MFYNEHQKASFFNSFYIVVDKVKMAMIQYSSVIGQDMFFTFADMAQSVERRLGKAEVTGSIPVISLAILRLETF